MNAMNGRVALLAIATALAACTSLELPKQWYKPGVNYSVDEFKRDNAACTKDRVLDEDCMRSRGWVSLSGDEDKGPTRPLTPAGKPGQSRPY
jgi:hypothetical protein